MRKKLKPPKSGSTARIIRKTEFDAHSRGKYDIGAHQTKGTTPDTRKYRSYITGKDQSGGHF
jgi:hypothetical protein